METKYVKVPFDVELAKRIQDGDVEGKIITDDGRIVRIVCFDAVREDRLVVLIPEGCIEKTYNYTPDGRVFVNGKSPLDLMLEIPEYMTFEDGDVVVTDDRIVVIRNPKIDDLNGLCFNLYVAYDCKSKTLFYCADFINQEKVRFATEVEKQIISEKLKSSKQPKDKEYLKRFFGIEEKPECKFKPKDWILCRCGKNEWTLCQFSHIHKNTGQCVSVNGLFWDIFIPYNEKTAHLLGTTEDYKEE